MLVVTAFTVYGKDNLKDSTKVANLDIAKSIEYNDKCKAQFKYCVEQSFVLDSVVLEISTFKHQHDSVVETKDLRIANLQNGATLDSTTIAEQKKLIKRQKVKGTIKVVTISTISATISSIVTAIAVFFGLK